MRSPLVGIVACALGCVVNSAGLAQEPGFTQRGYDALKRQVIADTARKEAARKHSMYLSDEHGRRAAQYFSQADAAGRRADQHRANSAAIRTGMEIDAAARRPYMIQVQPMSRGWYWIQPIR